MPPEANQKAAIDKTIEAQFRIRTVELPDDYEGPVIATLLDRPAADSNGRAVLYLHGYCDYFFQLHLADWFNARGYHFYALELRKYGRSWLPHQHPNYVRRMSEYYPELDEALHIIKATDGHEFLLLNGHSTGGLTASLYCAEGKERHQVDALFLNSPFFAHRGSAFRRRMVNAVGGWSIIAPYSTAPSDDTDWYGRSIYIGEEGRWDFHTGWKPLKGFPVYNAWLRAVGKGHRKVKKGLGLDLPVLVLTSNRTWSGDDYDPSIKTGDAVLDIQSMKKRAKKLGENVVIEEVPNGMHDLFLSEPEAVHMAFQMLDSWLSNLER